MKMFLAAIQMFYLHTYTWVCVGVCVCVIMSDYFLCSLSFSLFAVSLGFCIFIHIWRKSVQKGTCLHYNFRFSQSNCPSKLYRSVPDTRTWGQCKAFYFCFLYFFLLVSLWLDSFWPDIIWVMCVVFPECLSRSWLLACRVCRSCFTVAWWRWVALGCHG